MDQDRGDTRPKVSASRPFWDSGSCSKAGQRGFFVCLPYMGADPELAKRLEDIGCATVMPFGAHPLGFQVEEY
ncbi:MAG: hypothetical protein Ct9H300mP19_06390 [Dehalococcoidia bacterium]|nr:MAG: hypothetical protein Ct9H300mP19_06390 [Dehalococcoidia bacterium]